MPVITRFDTPGSLRDLPAGSPFYDTWHEKIRTLLGLGRAGPGGVGEFYNPERTDVNVTAQRHLVWMGFPRHLLTQHRDDRRLAFEKGEARGTMPGGRTTQVEYLEWFATRNKVGKITKVTFVTETPEYWEELFRAAPDTVLKLYRTLVSPSVQAADLVRPDGSYNNLNVWNTSRGIVHFIVNSPANSLNAAIGLATGGVDLLAGSPHAHDNFQLHNDTSLARTSADARVVLDVNAMARRRFSVSFAEPVGLYMFGPDDTGWTKPDGSPVKDYRRVVRGRPGMALRMEYEVPASEGFAVGDIRIGGRPIEFGGQIAEQITVVAVGAAGTRV